jgi:hypothetical protein
MVGWIHGVLKKSHLLKINKKVFISIEEVIIIILLKDYQYNKN